MSHGGSMRRATSRRTFVVGGAAVLTIALLPEDDAHAVPPPPPGAPVPPPSPLRMDARISRNHGHVFAIAIADVDRAVDRTFDLSGTSGHLHEVTFTRAHFMELQQGKIVRLASTTTGGHLHRIYARVRPEVLPPDETSVCDVVIGGKDDHELIIPRSHLEGDVDRTYDIQANSPHTHQVVVKGSDFARLRKGEQVIVKSGPAAAEGGHTHVVYISHGKPAARP